MQIVVDFTATWCGPCRIMSPYFAELAKSMSSAIFLKVDVDELKVKHIKLKPYTRIELWPSFLTAWVIVCTLRRIQLQLVFCTTLCSGNSCFLVWSQSVAEEYDVEAMPTFMLLKEGKVVEKVIGAKKEELQQTIAKHLNAWTSAVWSSIFLQRWLYFYYNLTSLVFPVMHPFNTIIMSWSSVY